MSNEKLSNRMLRAREMWHFYGHERPDFAEPAGAGQESVWDYPRPPRLAADKRLVTVSLNGVEIASTVSAIRMLETASPPTFYLPPGDVRTDWLESSPGQSFCEWKGQATYWTIAVPGQAPLQNAAWSYEQPHEEFRQITGCYSFFPALLDCRVDGVQVLPQPGGFYGGWITPELVGPFKGGPETQGW